MTGVGNGLRDMYQIKETKIHNPLNDFSQILGLKSQLLIFGRMPTSFFPFNVNNRRSNQETNTTISKSKQSATVNYFRQSLSRLHSVWQFLKLQLPHLSQGLDIKELRPHLAIKQGLTRSFHIKTLFPLVILIFLITKSLNIQLQLVKLQNKGQQ